MKDVHCIADVYHLVALPNLINNWFLKVFFFFFFNLTLLVWYHSALYLLKLKSGIIFTAHRGFERLYYVC